MNKNSKNPWKALSSYEIDDECVFCGRNTAIEELSSLIEYNQIVTLYGKSGIGKTSLLQAGVFPRLKLNDFKPKVIRLGEYFNTDIPYSKIILDAIGINFESIDYNNETINYNSCSLFCEVFKRVVISDEYDTKQVPVIILDQLEEVLLSQNENIETLLLQIAEWINFRKTIATDCHFVFSIREDDLYLLEDTLDSLRISSLRTTRYRLRPITKNDAKDIIKTPSENTVEIEDVAITKIMELLNGNKEDGYEPTALSLMCYQLYEEVKNDESPKFTIELIERVGYSSIVKYYKKAIVGLLPNEIEILESKFITSDGRRNFISEDDFKQLFVREQIRNKLINNGVCKILQNTNGKVEVIHDLLATAIKEVRDDKSKNLEQKLLKIKKQITFIIVCALFLLLYWAVIHVCYKPILIDVFFSKGTLNDQIISAMIYITPLLSIFNLIIISPALVSQRRGLVVFGIISLILSIGGLIMGLVCGHILRNYRVMILSIITMVWSVVYMLYSLKNNNEGK